MTRLPASVERVGPGVRLVLAVLLLLLSMQVSAQGPMPDPEIEWLPDGLLIRLRSGGDVVFDNGVSIAKGSELAIVLEPNE